MEKLFIFLFLATGSFLSATESGVRLYGEVEAKCRYSDFALFRTELTGGLEYKTDKLTIVSELQALYASTKEADQTLIRFDKTFFNYALTDYLNVTVGRDALSSYFDSKIQFGEKFNGFCVDFDWNYFSLKSALFMPGINEYIGCATQVEVKPFDMPFLVNYSLTMWDNEYDVFKEYLISQIQLKVAPNGQIFGMGYMVFAGFLENHEADDNNRAAFAGVEVGQLISTNKHDWKAGICYQKIERNAIPYFDRNGLRSAEEVEGLIVDASYCVTDNVALSGKVEFSKVKEFKNLQNAYEVSAVCKF